MIQKEIIKHKQVKRQICMVTANRLCEPGIMNWCKSVTRLVLIGDLPHKSAIVVASDKGYPLYVENKFPRNKEEQSHPKCGFVGDRPEDDPTSVWVHSPGTSVTADDWLVHINDLEVRMFDYEEFRSKWMKRS